MSTNKRLAILVGGGPAPGINSVISSATIRAALAGREVIGITDGFKWIMRGDISKVRTLSIDEVSRIHFRGGSYIGTARDNPTTDEKFLETTVNSLLRLNVDKLITIGGDDTAYSALRLSQVSDGRVHVVHVPKTIDNDLNLPYEIPTFGFQTARHLGTKLVENLMVDSTTTSRWYFVISMGRSAGHLALGIGKATGATLTLIPEEFREEKIKLRRVVDILVGAIVKRLAYGKPFGIAVIAEGIASKIDEKDLEALEDVERDEHGHIRIAEINIGGILKEQVQKELKRYGQKMTIVAKNIGYELRCSDPIPYDIEYTRDLGFCAAEYLLEGGNGALISIQTNKFVPIPLESLINPDTKKMSVRKVDINSESYKIAYKYMVRLIQEDFDDPHELAKFAAICNLSLDEFRKLFEYTLGDHGKVWNKEDVKRRSEEHVRKFGLQKANIQIEEQKSKNENREKINREKKDSSKKSDTNTEKKNDNKNKK
ncbi:MAG: diphosphate--fructose-6-phosphate 1-phosphotransferase [Spirochaetota bacterium]